MHSDIVLVRFTSGKIYWNVYTLLILSEAIILIISLDLLFYLTVLPACNLPTVPSLLPESRFSRSLFPDSLFSLIFFPSVRPAHCVPIVFSSLSHTILFHPKLPPPDPSDHPLWIFNLSHTRIPAWIFSRPHPTPECPLEYFPKPIPLPNALMNHLPTSPTPECPLKETKF